jgi:hypothetical protein
MPVTLATIRAFRWSDAAQRWIGPGNRFVSQRELQRALATFVESAAAEARGMAARVADGHVTVGEWQTTTAGLVKDVDLAMTAAARGGFANLTQSDYGRAGQRLRTAYARLERFAREVAARRLTPAAIAARAAMYVRAGNGIYQNERRGGAVEVFTEERRVLGNAEHCDQCIAAAAAGWKPLGTLPPIGTLQCLSNCRCSFEFRNP